MACIAVNTPPHTQIKEINIREKTTFALKDNFQSTNILSDLVTLIPVTLIYSTLTIQAEWIFLCSFRMFVCSGSDSRGDNIPVYDFSVTCLDICSITTSNAHIFPSVHLESITTSPRSHLVPPPSTVNIAVSLMFTVM